jgi:hypothetical protein
MRRRSTHAALDAAASPTWTNAAVVRSTAGHHVHNVAHGQHSEHFARVARLLFSSLRCVSKPLLFTAIWSYCVCLSPSASLAQPMTKTQAKIILSVAPIPTIAKPSKEAPQLAWSTGNGSPGIVTVSSNGPKETFFAWGPEGSASAPWLSSNHTYVFRLYSIAPKRRLLARLRVRNTAYLEVLGSSQAPTMTSPVENRLLQLLPFVFATLITVLAVMYVREVRSGV